MWEDTRGLTGPSLRGRAHSDDAKERADESSRSDQGSGSSARHAASEAAGRLPKWAVPVVAAVSVLVVVGGTYAVTRGGSDDDPTSVPGAGADATPGNDDSDDADDVDDGEDTVGGPAGGGEVVLVGTVDSVVVATLTSDGGSEVREGTLSFDLDCSAGSTCTLGGFVAGGGLGSAAESFFNSNLNLAWTGGSGTWSQTGKVATSCADVDPTDFRPLVSGTLTVDGEEVTIQTSRPEYELGSATEADPYCSGSATAFEVTGTLS